MSEEKNKKYYRQLIECIEKEREQKAIYPSEKELFTAFNNTAFSDIKLVILGQEPYHGENQVHGLSFSVNHNVKVPPSLKNIFKEIENDLSCLEVKDGCLESWSKQGVFLLNSILTVEKSKPLSHKKIGWKIFTDYVIKMISEKHENVVFMLWGANAQAKEKLINTSKHCVLKSSHPSPLSSYRGFLGCKHFSKCNDYFKKTGQNVIEF